MDAFSSLARWRSASLVLYRLGPDRVQPLLSLFTRGHACFEKIGVADHDRKVFEHQRCGWFRGRNPHALHRSVVAESAFAILVLRGSIALSLHEVIEAELPAGARQPQVHVLR